MGTFQVSEQLFPVFRITAKDERELNVKASTQGQPSQLHQNGQMCAWERHSPAACQDSGT